MIKEIRTFSVLIFVMKDGRVISHVISRTAHLDQTQFYDLAPAAKEVWRIDIDEGESSKDGIYRVFKN